LTANKMLAWRRERGLLSAGPPPDTVILTYSRSLFAAVRRRYSTRALKSFFGEVLALKRTNGRVAVAGNFGLGAPVTAVLVEDLVAFGVQRFVSLGLAGGLQPEMQPGEVVLASAAIGDEGVSRRYWPHGRYLQAKREWMREVGEALRAGGVDYREGQTWSFDAPYREPRDAALDHQAHGVATVEMEAAALLALGLALSVQTVSVLVVADVLADGQWQLVSNLRPVERSLKQALDALVLHWI
jgi:uridine phosphorylase